MKHGGAASEILWGRVVPDPWSYSPRFRVIKPVEDLVIVSRETSPKGPQGFFEDPTIGPWLPLIQGPRGVE